MSGSSGQASESGQKPLLTSGGSLSRKWRSALQGGASEELLMALCEELGVNVPDGNGATALHVACFHGHELAVKFLLRQGAQLDTRDKNGSSPLHSAAFRGHAECVRLLLEAGANHNLSDVDLSTPLHKAAFSGSVECLRLLLDAGAEDAPDVDGATALHKAAFNDHPSCVALLLERKVSNLESRDSRGSTTIHKAAYSGSAASTKILLDNGADPAALDGAGHSSLHVACHRNHPEVVKLIVASYPTAVNTLSREGSDETALHKAAAVGARDCVALLLQAGAKPGLLNASGMTAFEVAAANQHDALLDLLRSAKGKEEASDSEENSGNDDDNAGGVRDTSGRPLAPSNSPLEVERVDGLRGNKPVILQRVDRWGFLGVQELSADERLHKQKEIEREVKWVEMRGNWDVWMTRRKSKLRARCLKGIPDSMRTFAWVRLSGAHLLRASKGKTYYSDLVSRDDDNSSLEVIGRDLHRTFPDHVQFNTAKGRSALMRVLKAYSFHNPSIGYCQGMGFVAALFLMYCVEEEDAFWMLVQMVDKYGLGGLWDSTLTDVPKMCYIHTELLRKFCPRIYSHLEGEGISGALYAPSFYITGYTYSLPWPCVLRVWDAFLVDGMVALHATGVGLLQMHESAILQLPFEKLMPFLRFNHIVSDAVDEDGRTASGGHISHVQLADALLTWLPKVKRPAARLEKSYQTQRK